LNAVPFDPLKLAERLEAGGFTSEQARTAASAMADAASAAEVATKADLAGLATKTDLQAFATKADLAAFATKADLAAFATKADLAAFATKADLAELKADVLKWTVGAIGIQTLVMVGAVITLVRMGAHP
jgi:hypothetical protein